VSSSRGRIARLVFALPTIKERRWRDQSHTHARARARAYATVCMAARGRDARVSLNKVGGPSEMLNRSVKFPISFSFCPRAVCMTLAPRMFYPFPRGGRPALTCSPLPRQYSQCTYNIFLTIYCASSLRSTSAKWRISWKFRILSKARAREHGTNTRMPSMQRECLARWLGPCLADQKGKNNEIKGNAVGIYDISLSKIYFQLARLFFM
jgi:hypothetical protein